MTVEAAPATDAAPATRPRSAGVGRAIAVEASVVVALTALAAGAYVWTKAPLYNPRGSIDPWLYTALWTNFDQIYSMFVQTYYAARMPWILPGYALNAIFDPRTAALVLHTIFFLGGGVLLYLLCRRFFGWVAAATAYATLIGSQLYFDAHRWDYQEGAVVTFLVAGVYFATPLTRNRVARVASLAAAGFMSAALVNTQIFAVVFLLGLPLLYLVVLLALPRRARLRQFAMDATAFAGGAGILVTVCGVFAETHGGRLLFFMPQINAALNSPVEQNKQALGVWLHREPRFFVPVFAVLIAGVVLATKRLDVLPRRALAAAAAWTGLVFGLLVVWEFAGNGFFFEYVWYFSPFLPPMLMCFCGFAAAFVRDRIAGPAVLVAAIAAVGAPLIWIYKDDLQSRVADDVGRQQYWVMGISMAVAMTLSVGAFLTRRLKTALAISATAMVLFASSYGMDVSLGTFLEGSSDPETGHLYDLGQDLIAHLRRSGFDDEFPRFWFNGSTTEGVFGAVQSLYYSGFTYAGLAMPMIDADFRSRMKLFNADKLVLLCESRRCGNARRALSRAGYDPKLKSRARLTEGSLTMWVEIYGVANQAI